ncbi:MAG: DUF2283 domain-containing protein [Dehalococcoidia bacterium]|nr:DUF2283 domain-containing protein [Dehalococcoidia bacterium]
MKIIYDPAVDVLRLIFNAAVIEESDEEKPGIMLDFDKDGNVVGMEILDASRRMENPRSVEYELPSASCVTQNLTITPSSVPVIRNLK